MRAILAKPRGFCAGVERAIRTVELALEQHGRPIYVRKEIVHNSHVVRRLRQQGAVFVDDLELVPEGAVTILSAHGSPPDVYEQARRRRLRLIDATCPLVRKVHVEVRRYAARGYRIILIGHAGHDEVIGTIRQAPGNTVLVESVEDVAKLSLTPREPAVILTQTTLSQDDCRETVSAVLERFPQAELPRSNDICYATQNRQQAVRGLCGRIDLLLVVGSENSSNSLRLTEVARTRGVPAHLIDGPDNVRPEWLQGVGRVGVTSGASAPEHVVQAVLDELGQHGVESVEEIEARDEGVSFRLPRLVEPACEAPPTEEA